MIMETEKLGNKFIPVLNKLKSIQLNKCGHEKNPISGSECIKTLVKDNRYVIATQDRDLQEWIRRQVGVALLYLHNVVPTLEDPSMVTRKFVERKSKRAVNVSGFESQQLKQIKKKEGIVKEKKEIRAKIKKKGPNPLSCMKKQTKGPINAIKDKAINKMKKKRDKVKISQHVKEELKNKK
jgi:U3 small nucleolar RNA-associated protein 23